MAEAVVIVGARRARERVLAHELAQMAGRAGRTHESKTADVHLIVSDEDLAFAADAVEYGGDWDVVSHLDEVHEFAFHVLPDIVSGSVKTLDDLQEWYRQTFAAFTGCSLPMSDVYQFLDECMMVRGDESSFEATQLAEVATGYYFRPEDVCAWCENFGEVFSKEAQDNDMAIVWALANTPSQNCVHGYISVQELANECLSSVRGYGFIADDELVFPMMVWWKMLDGPSLPEVRPFAKQWKRDYGRLHKVLTTLNTVMKWEEEDFFEELNVRISYVIPKELAFLCALDGIGKTHAAALYNVGVRTIQDLVSKSDEIEAIADHTLIMAVQRAIQDAIRGQSSSKLRQSDAEQNHIKAAR
jgi:replicative superfamily II helicase